jgi:hypothetical protein
METKKRVGTVHLLPAVPPEEYQGTIADWIEALVSRGLMKSDESYTDLWIPEDVWVKIVEECEK